MTVEERLAKLEEEVGDVITLLEVVNQAMQRQMQALQRVARVVELLEHQIVNLETRSGVRVQ